MKFTFKILIVKFVFLTNLTYCLADNHDIYEILIKVLSLKEYERYKFLKPQNLSQITKLSTNVRLKTLSLSVQSKF